MGAFNEGSEITLNPPRVPSHCPLRPSLTHAARCSRTTPHNHACQCNCVPSASAAARAAPRHKKGWMTGCDDGALSEPRRPQRRSQAHIVPSPPKKAVVQARPASTVWHRG